MQRKEEKWNDREFSFASHLEIYASQMVKIFSYEVNAGVNIYHYLLNGDMTALPDATVDDSKLFRHADIETLFYSHNRLRIDIFDISGDQVAQQILFNIKNENWDSWFKKGNVKEATFWDFESELKTADVKMQLHDMYFRIADGDQCNQNMPAYLIAYCSPNFCGVNYAPERSSCGILYADSFSWSPVNQLQPASKMQIFIGSK